MKRLIMAAGLAVAACGQPNDQEPVVEAVTPTAPVAAAPVTPTPVVMPLSDADRGRVCRATIAVLNGRDPSIIRVINDACGITRVRYTRDDGTVWTNECRVDPASVSWRMHDGSPGRWRTEDTITYRIDGDQIYVRLSMDGELVSEKTYTIR